MTLIKWDSRKNKAKEKDVSAGDYIWFLTVYHYSKEKDESAGDYI